MSVSRPNSAPNVSTKPLLLLFASLHLNVSCLTILRRSEVEMPPSNRFVLFFVSQPTRKPIKQNVCPPLYTRTFLVLPPAAAAFTASERCLDQLPRRHVRFFGLGPRRGQHLFPGMLLCFCVAYTKYPRYRRKARAGGGGGELRLDVVGNPFKVHLSVVKVPSGAILALFSALGGGEVLFFLSL